MNPSIGPASADIGQRLLEVDFSTRLSNGEQAVGRHNLTRLTVSTLGHIAIAPGTFDVSTQFIIEGFDRLDADVLSRGDRGDARPDRLSIDHDRARAAHADPTAVLGACQPEVLPEDPEKWFVIGNLDGVCRTADLEFKSSVFRHCGRPLSRGVLNFVKMR